MTTRSTTHVSSSLWANVSRVTNLYGRSLRVPSKRLCLCYCHCHSLFVVNVMSPHHIKKMFMGGHWCGFRKAFKSRLCLRYQAVKSFLNQYLGRSSDDNQNSDATTSKVFLKRFLTVGDINISCIMTHGKESGLFSQLLYWLAKSHASREFNMKMLEN